MKIKILKTIRDDDSVPYKKGDLLLVDTDYAWDPDKVIILAVLARGISPQMSEYKENLRTPTIAEIDAYLTETPE